MSFLLGLPILLLILLAIVALAIHFLPTIVAGSRHARNFWLIFLLNFFFGWTLIGWIAALIWAAVDQPRYVIAYLPPPYNR
jgi:hypothetical protein